MKKHDLKSFKALIINKNKSNKIEFKLGNTKVEDLKKGEILVKVAYSSLNYKDLLMLSGNPGLVRKYPHIPGIDASGIIYKSKSKKFKIGEKVFIVAQPCGVKSFGGLSEFLKISSKWATKISPRISLKNSMVIGTAGFTAMLAVKKLLIHGLKKDNPILVSGASGGVGAISILILSKLGFSTVALTRESKSIDFLKKIGAKKTILLKDFLNEPNLPLLKENFSGILDNIGEEIISLGSKQLQKNGKIISIGMASATNTDLSVYPLILRGVQIVGVNAESATPETRKKIWRDLEILIKDKKLKLIYRECDFSNIIQVVKNCQKKHSAGRIVVKIS